MNMDKATDTDSSTSLNKPSNGTDDHQLKDKNKNTEATDKNKNDDALRTIYKTLLPSRGTLKMAYLVPEETYQYRPTMTVKNPPHWEELLNKFTDFDIATAPLIPLENLSTSLRQLQKQMEELSHQFDKQEKSIERASANTNHTHKCVKVKATFHTPQNASHSPSSKRYSVILTRI